MIFPSFVFLLFFLPLLLILYYLVFRNNLKRQNILLLIFSLFFYAWGEPIFVFAMLVCIVINWAFGYICIADDKYLQGGGIFAAERRV